MSRQRFQRGTLRTSVPAKTGRPERKLPRGTYWARWYRYIRQADGSEKRTQREKIITRELAEKYHIAKDYRGPLNKSDAQRVLDLLIAADSGAYVPPDTAALFGQVAREYLALAKPNWGPHTSRTSTNLIERHLIGTLGLRPIADITDSDLQAFLNNYICNNASKSLLSKLLLYLRAIFDSALDKKLIERNPARKLRAKSRRRASERSLTYEECRRLFSVVDGRNHLIIRMFVQLGLRPEEMFALRKDDVELDSLRIDEAIVEGEVAQVKTHASEASVYLPPDLYQELKAWSNSLSDDPRAWLFPSFPRRNPRSAQLLEPRLETRRYCRGN